MYAFTSSRSFSTLISWAVNSTWSPLRKRYSTVAPCPAGCVITGSKRPQLPSICFRRSFQPWKAFGTLRFVVRGFAGYSFSARQVVGRLGILPPVLKLAGQAVQRVGAPPVFGSSATCW